MESERTEIKKMSLISLEVENAFYRADLHSIMVQVIVWKLGVKSFLINRKFRIRTKHTVTTYRPLENGLPQGSPLSDSLYG